VAFLIKEEKERMGKYKIQDVTPSFPGTKKAEKIGAGACETACGRCGQDSSKFNS